MEQKLRCAALILISIALLIRYTHQNDETVSKGAAKAAGIQKAMYDFLRNMALPAGDPAESIDQRFLLQIPGKLLNPLDYDPKNDSVDSTVSRYDAFIPPKIAENMFRLTDITPLKSGESDESFTASYQTVLNALEIKNFVERNKQQKEDYEKVIKELSAEVPHPDSDDKKARRIKLYRDLQETYYNLSRDVENEIEAKRQEYEKEPVKYQIWFQNNYPTMQARLENAYMEWLVFGQKEIVEAFKAKIDTSSIAAELEAAKVSLRSSGKLALDRTSTIYPVHFEPSNWYEYLRPRKQPPTREQIQMQIGDIDAKIAMLESLKSAAGIPGASDFVKRLDNDTTNAKDDVDEMTKAVQKMKLDCYETEICNATEYSNTEGALMTATTNAAVAKAKADSMRYQLYTDEEAKKTLANQIEMLNKRRNRLESLLNEAVTISDDSLYKDVNTTEIVQDLRAGWTEFEFDASEESKKVDASSSTVATEASVSYNNLVWGVGGSASYSRSSSDFSEELKSTNVKIKGKYLKVFIKRPWFKSNLFKSDQLSLKGDKMYVAPGPMPEKEFLAEATKSNKKYLLPEYVTAFLLAKDIEMNFIGVDASAKSHVMEQSASATLSGNYLCFSASASASYGSSESSLQTESTATGLKIRIPGAQIIGYFTKLMPCFPHDKCPVYVKKGRKEKA